MSLTMSAYPWVEGWEVPLNAPLNYEYSVVVAIFYPFSQICEIKISLLSLQKQPNTAPNLFQRGVEYGKYVRGHFGLTLRAPVRNICIYIYIYIYICMYVYICSLLSLSLSIYIYIYICIYIYIERERETSLRTFCPAEKRQASSSGLAFVCTSGSDAKRFGEGPLGSALMGSLQISCLLTEGLPGYSRQPNCVFPKVPGRTPFSPNLSKCITFAAAPLMATPFVRHQRM